MRKKGLVHIYTGDGKGKTTAALGLAIRAAGSGIKVLVVQFFKEDSAPSGELEFLKKSTAGQIEVLRSNCRHPIFTKGKTDYDAIKKAITATFETARRKVLNEGIGLVVLDEVNSVVNGGWFTIDELLDFIETRPDGLEVVLTGRDAPLELVKAADYVTEMLKIKHPFDAGIAARRGIEF